MRKIILTDEQEKYIVNNYMTQSQQKIADTIGVKLHTVAKWLKEHNYYKKKYMFSDYDNQFIIDNYTTLKYADIANILGFTERQIRGRVKTMGLRKNRLFNSNYFSVIDTSTKAYYIGLIYADGWIVCNNDLSNYEFGIELQYQDKYIIDALNKELGGVHEVTIKEPCKRMICGIEANIWKMCKLRVYSKQLVYDLKHHGIIENKSAKGVYPIVPDNLFFDFLRGYIDGDGCYYINRNNKTQINITCGNIEPLQFVQDKLDDYSIKSSIYQEKERKYRLIITNTVSVNNLINLLYYDNNVICLKRKYNKIKSNLKYGLAV